MKMSIKYKSLIGYSIIFFTAFIIFNSFIEKTINKHNKDIITEDMWELKRNTDVYLTQYFFMNNLKISKDNFQIKCNEITKELSFNMNTHIITYSSEGKVLRDSLEQFNMLEKDGEDLRLAVETKIGYTINHRNDEVIVKFSYPVMMKNEKIGIIRCIRNYSKLYNSGEKIVDMIRIFTIILFIIIFLFSLLISNKIISPIIKLSKYTKHIAQGEFDVNTDIKSNDEIGELANDFSCMTKKIKSQISIIEKDRDTLIELNNHRKVFFDNVTHELKTPLTTILGYAEAIRDEGCENKFFFNKGINNICSESKRLHNMVVNLLELSFEDSTDIYDNLEEVNISQLLKNTCEEMNFKAERYGCKIEYLIEPKIIVEGIKDKIKEVFINIIDNSIKYGKVNSSIDVHLYKNENFAEIIIKDDGKGISQDKLKKIFEPFFRGDKRKAREKGSNGLGLTIVKSIIKNHNGEINIDSGINKGTKVMLKFLFKK